jgi:hypothetical protein
MFLRRFVLVISIVTCGSLTLAAAASAAGGLGPGTFSLRTASADAFFSMGGPDGKGGPPPVSWSVSVNRGLNSIHPRGGGAPIVQQDTMLFVSQIDATGNGAFGCFVIPDGDFVVSRDLQSATLNTTLTADEECYGFGSPVDGGKAGGFAGGGGGGNLSLPLTINVSWSATSATMTQSDAFMLRCLNFNLAANSTSQSVVTSASGTISSLTGSFTDDYSDLAAGRDQVHINADFPAACA